MNEHEPDPQFVDNLEWQLTTALRRKDRFARPASGRAMRAARTAALMMVCVIGGAGGVVGAEHLQQSREKELLLARNSVQVETAKLLLGLEQQRLERAEVMIEQGLIDSREAGKARLAADDAALELERLTLATEEIEASGRTPDRSLTAPLVGNRDFVSEGLRLERMRVGLRHQRMADERTRLEQFVEVGLVSYAELSRAEQQVLVLEHDLRAIDERLELRADFLLGRQDARTTTLLELYSEAKIALERIEGTIGPMRADHERVQALSLAGRIGESERTESEAAVRRAEGELELRRIELELLKERLGR